MTRIIPERCMEPSPNGPWFCSRRKGHERSRGPAHEAYKGHYIEHDQFIERWITPEATEEAKQAVDALDHVELLIRRFATIEDKEAGNWLERALREVRDFITKA